MDKKVDIKVEFPCKICNKHYVSYKSLWNHNKKFHSDFAPKCTIITPNSTKNAQFSTENAQKSPLYNCKYCNKSFSRNYCVIRHEKICKLKNNDINELDKMKEETKQKEILLQLAKEESKILQLKLKLQKSTKVDNITLKKLNKLLIERNNKIKNINSNNTINNTQIINNFQLVGFGKEEVIESLTNQDKKLIMNSKYCSLEKLIEIVHCGKYNQFKNIIISNIKDNYMYKYDDKLGCFILSTKQDVLSSLIDYRLDDLEIIYNDLLSKNKLDEKTKDIIENFINKINYSDSKYTDLDGKQHDNYKQYKINEIKILLFNNQDKITNDISLLLTTNEVEYEPKQIIC
jgi:hypothetical protein